ncbi:MAG TPA: M28 family peptidase [Streptosporangiaceae bacterium]|nr:M28 family peptidase [Streptosporangiaceae bacterium]
MRLAALAAAIHEAFDTELAMTDVEAVCRHDRFQASAGIAAAADYVADRAQAAGLADVQVLSFPADGAQRWWTYHAPQSWTPVRATLAISGSTLLRYPEQPYRLAAYSAPITAGRQPLALVRWSDVRRGAADPCGALVLADEPVSFPVLAGQVAAAGAAAVAADPLGSVRHRTPDQVGRLELLAGSTLAAFSVTAAELTALLAAADRGVPARVEVEVAPADHAMPVVTGVLPGAGSGSEAGQEEVLLSAHLCHPRPSANDNASGVVALLGAARVLARPRARRTTGRAGAGPGGLGVRFLWGPEFVGLAAYLHDYVGTGRAPRPAFAVSVDMAGEDVGRCGGPLVIERGPDDIPSFLPALAQRCASLLPPASRSYSGAVPCEPWTFRTTPFVGASDHMLAADRPVRSQAIALGHWPDRANHSSADTLELVDPAELTRTAVIAGTLAAALGNGIDGELAADVRDAVTSWAASHVLSSLPGCAPTRAAAASQAGDCPVLDPRDGASAGRLLRHRGAVAASAVRSLAAIGAGPGWLDSAAGWIDGLVGATAAVLEAPAERCEVREVRGRALERCWPGPVNLRALTGAAPPAGREWLNDRYGADRGGTYARATALMRGVDGRRDRDEVAWWAALSSELPMPVSFAESFIDILCQAGWARESGEPS